MGHGIVWGARAFVIPPPVSGGPDPSTRPDRSTSNVVVIARLHPVKHLELLLDAWPSVLSRNPEARLVIAGEGAPAYVRSLQSRAADLGASVQFVGLVEGIAKARLLADSDLFVLPSFHENFGIAVLEAIGAGLPVVITPEVQLAAFVREHELGRVAGGTASALADAVIATLGDAELRSRCGHDGARILAERFSRPLIGRELLEMYRFAIAHPPG